MGRPRDIIGAIPGVASATIIPFTESHQHAVVAGATE